LKNNNSIECKYINITAKELTNKGLLALNKTDSENNYLFFYLDSLPINEEIRGLNYSIYLKIPNLIINSS
jgi:hypothetical protein